MKNIPLNETALIYQTNGDIIGGYVIERTSSFVRMKDAFQVNQNGVGGSTEPIYTRGGDIGRIEIPFSAIEKWKIPPRDL